MTKVSTEILKAQLDRTVGTLTSEAKLLELYIKDFREQLETGNLKAAAKTMMRVSKLTMTMRLMLKDTVRYTTHLWAARNSPGVRQKASSSGSVQLCPECHCYKPGWPDDWANIASKGVRYACADCVAQHRSPPLQGETG